MGISILGSIGGIDVLESAKSIIAAHGHIGYSAYDPYKKKYSLFGAIAKACGASDKSISLYEGDVLELLLQGQQLGLFMEVVVFLESLVDSDLEEWCLDASTDDVITLIDRASDRIKISIV